MGRPDPALTLLKDIGFLPIRLPRADLGPLFLVSRNGKDLDLLGDLGNAMTANGAALPPIVPDIETANKISGQSSSRVKRSIGLELLGGIIGALTGQNLNVGAGYENAKTVTFEFSDVKVDRIDIILLDQFLNKAEINSASRHIETLMIDDVIGVVTATVKSNRFLISAQDEAGRNLKLDVPVIKNIASGSLGIESTNSSNTQVAYEGAKAIAFGAQVIRLFFDDQGNYTAFNPVKVGEAAIRKEELDPSVGLEPFTLDSGFIRVQGGASRAAGGD